MERTITTLVAVAVAVFALVAGVAVPAPIGATGATGAAGHLYFQRDTFIYAAHADGGNVRQITRTGTARQPDANPAVSPDGSQLAYTHGVAEIDALPTAGGTPRIVDNHRPLTGDPTWSPDGRYIAHDMEWPCLITVYNAPDSEAPRSVIAINKPGARNSLTSVYDGAACAVFRLYPAWSPDGRTFVVTENEDGKDARGHYVSLGLDTVDVKSAKDTQITPQERYDYLRPAYSPDGRTIACIRRPLGHKGQGNLWLLGTDGTGGHALAPGADVTRPAWSPDGATIAYGASGTIYAVPASGGSPTPLVHNASYPAWGR